MENILHAVHVGKDKYHNTPVVIGDTEYRLYYKSLHDTLFHVSKVLESVNEGTWDFKTACVFLASCLWIVEHKSTPTNHSKLDGLKSLSTCCLDNKFCQFHMQNSNTICSKCYASTQQRRQHGLTDHNLINGVILRNILLTIESLQTLPLWNEKFFRIESFGDVENNTQARNYVRLCKAFPQTQFAVWTKNPRIWEIAFDTEGRPENLSFVVSSLYVNETWHSYDSIADEVDHVFTVYDSETAKVVDINCGGRACLHDCIKNCKGCYYRNTEMQIREQLK